MDYMDYELYEQLVSRITEVITRHNLLDYGSECQACCHRELYGEGKGSSLSRHRAEMIVKEMALEQVFRKAGITPTSLPK